MDRLIDWWTVRGDKWGVLNLDFKVELHPDPDTSAYDHDVYTEETIEAWERGCWQYVVVNVIPVSADLTDRIEAHQSLASIEWGDLPDGRIDRDSLLDHPVKRLAQEAVMELLRGGFVLETAEGSDFAAGKLSPAPF